MSPDVSHRTANVQPAWTRDAGSLGFTEGVGNGNGTGGGDGGIPHGGDGGPGGSFGEGGALLGICTNAAGDGFGLVSASYSKAFGSTAAPHAGQWGLLSRFGSVIKPREGATLGVLSCGYAREYDDIAGTNAGPNSDFVNGQALDGTSYPTGKAPPASRRPRRGARRTISSTT